MASVRLPEATASSMALVSRSSAETKGTTSAGYITLGPVDSTGSTSGIAGSAGV
jgi:hypothetical protein